MDAVATKPSIAAAGSRAILEVRGVTKRFPGVTALDDVSLAVELGACHALCGENGAGKSTLGRIIAGILTPDAGELRIDGRPVRIRSPLDAARAGIGLVHQEAAGDYDEALTILDKSDFDLIFADIVLGDKSGID
ncbi:MAG: ATP-binding cassette domain-containing protein, partial [Phycisphaerae bacterium]|nr:ATP-binding cassette domain-containing protein [Phycisphaerae bacterium]